MKAFRYRGYVAIAKITSFNVQKKMTLKCVSMAKEAATWHTGQNLEIPCQDVEADYLIQVSHHSPIHIAYTSVGFEEKCARDVIFHSFISMHFNKFLSRPASDALPHNAIRIYDIGSQLVHTLHVFVQNTVFCVLFHHNILS